MREGKDSGVTGTCAFLIFESVPLRNSIGVFRPSLGIAIPYCLFLMIRIAYVADG